jgi:hypothetical protein
MKSNRVRSKPASIAKTRWVAYAAAGAATALAGSQSAEAAIHYSGPVNERFFVGDADSFNLDQPGDFFRLSHVGGFFGGGRFSISGIASDAFRGFWGLSSYHYASKLSLGQRISTGHFTSGYPGFLAGGYEEQWGKRGTGFIGFRFNNGAGVQYGWARITTSGPAHDNLILLDYAYADPGERLRAGETSEDTLSDEQSPDQGSLGGLALGAAGLLAWRKSRSR